MGTYFPLQKRGNGEKKTPEKRKKKDIKAGRAWEGNSQYHNFSLIDSATQRKGGRRVTRDLPNGGGGKTGYQPVDERKKKSITSLTCPKKYPLEKLP